jgi:hypothetical protein
MARKRAFVEPRIMQAVSHPIRSEFLRLLAKEVTLSPKGAIALLPSMERLSLSQVNYHMWVLGRDSLVEPAGWESGPDEGISYRATAKGREVMTLIGVLPDKEQGT